MLTKPGFKRECSSIRPSPVVAVIDEPPQLHFGCGFCQLPVKCLSMFGSFKRVNGI